MICLEVVQISTSTLIVGTIIINIPIVAMWIWDEYKAYKMYMHAQQKLENLLSDVIYLDVSKEDKDMLQFLCRHSDYDKDAKYIRSIIKQEIKLNGLD